MRAGMRNKEFCLRGLKGINKKEVGGGGGLLPSHGEKVRHTCVAEENSYKRQC